ncbi:undecaprenyldiphospho-muramoylpentapeptide beta-N-acetylglucosaminyltransferase [Alkaliphilus serpentinus]|uniref:UDP-N-acetylglucosamine--N-acetylmuramyl-(pentapeptide) pyrophosphoryl-undecaprenol N-acetylglucosamine transferase n=1 Tax=Alkaliphilus serpentinus TaxID=1482731 RepID=A0A833HRC8_9FIRM|nr:undecaprenyldiphospho-muramoylpentapeptide beta-N-acetylglucosaminyltransferase [Alkaliphilus serpentinus]KAB3533193.1 undecaprenyldiphospho-muramoylpentapeptide beta-N-acetylglucosaminyltransferase [Alkaliphilus serpentinus]
MKFVISGGGTGGHIYPAIAIANKIKHQLPSAEILFIGTKEGLESDVVPNAGYEMKHITVSYLRRSISLHNVKSGFKLMKGFFQAWRILKDFKPDVVIGTGGFVCGPVLYVASAMMGLKTIIHEQNVFPGLTNRILSRHVDVILLSFQEASRFFRYPQKLVYTGNPIRDAFFLIEDQEAKNHYNIDSNQPIVLVVGGSGGSSKLNHAIAQLLTTSKALNYKLIWATGKNHYHKVIEAFDDEILRNHMIIPYIDDMPYAVKAADIVVCSAGAITIAELTAAGKPSILIPKAHTAENHQEYNAKAMEEKGAAIMLKENQLSAEILDENIKKILGDSKLLESMKMASRKSAKDDAAEAILKEIIRL